MLGLLLLAAAGLSVLAALLVASHRPVTAVRYLALALLLVIAWAALPVLGLQP